MTLNSIIETKKRLTDLKGERSLIEEAKGDLFREFLACLFARSASLKNPLALDPNAGVSEPFVFVPLAVFSGVFLSSSERLES
jgi:hypothetical protein